MQLDERVLQVLNMLESSGYKAYLVGGCVRDHLMGLPVQDFDITTAARPEQVKQIFSAYPVLETGIKHGTVTVLFNSLPLEITTFRQDGIYLDNRHPSEVRFSDSLQEDLLRRDFTMNALAYSPAEGIKDFFNGRVDIEHKLIRAVGDPDSRFVEDALRILRGLRFAVVLGFEIEDRTNRAMHVHKELLNNIAPERIFVELKKMLCGVNVKKVIEENIEILAVIIPELLPMRGFAQHNPYHNYDVLTHTLNAVENIAPVPHLRLAALLHDIGKPRTFTRGTDGIGHFYGHMHTSQELAANILTRLRVDNYTRDKVLCLVKHHDTQIIAEEKYVKRWLNKLGIENFMELLLLKSSDMVAQKGDLHDYRLADIEKLRCIASHIKASGAAFNLKDLAVDGRDLIVLGLPQGKIIGVILNQLLELVMESELANQREEIINYVKKNFC